MEVESIQVIPMNKESIFVPEYRENETDGVIYSFADWVTQRKTAHEIYYNTYPLNGIMSIPERTEYFDEEGAKRIAGYFTGFMTSPCALLAGRTLMVKSRAVLKWSDLDKLDNGKIKFLYDFVCKPPLVAYAKIDPVTFLPVILDEPQVSNVTWKIRYEEFE